MNTITHLFPVPVNGLAIGYTCYDPNKPWDVCDPEVGEIWSFATYGEAYAFAKEVGLP